MKVEIHKISANYWTQVKSPEYIHGVQLSNGYKFLIGTDTDKYWQITDGIYALFKKIDLPDSILYDNFPKELVDEFKQSNTGIYSITVYAEKPTSDCGCSCC